MSTAVLIHGCHLQANLNGCFWASIVLGVNTPSPLYGRIPMGLEVAYSFRASCIMFGTGASTQGNLIEAHAMHLAAQGYAEGMPEDQRVYLRLRLAQSPLFEQAQNTREEIRAALLCCRDNHYDTLVLVSSPWHIERAHAEALELAHVLRQNEKVPSIYAVASYGSTEQVVISEPPHRGDRPTAPIHLAVKRADRLGRNPAISDTFYSAFNMFLQEWENKLPPK